MQAFAEYGEIEEGAVITDRMTGRSRGFGFVTFTKSESAYRALREGTKMIDVSFQPPASRSQALCAPFAACMAAY